MQYRKRLGLKDWTQRIIEGVEIVGIDRLESPNAFRKIFWALLILSATAFGVFHTYDRTKSFLSYDSSISVYENYPSTMPFPLISFCFPPGSLNSLLTNKSALRLANAAAELYYGINIASNQAILWQYKNRISQAMLDTMPDLNELIVGGMWNKQPELVRPLIFRKFINHILYLCYELSWLQNRSTALSGMMSGLIGFIRMAPGITPLVTITAADGVAELGPPIVELAAASFNMIEVSMDWRKRQPAPYRSACDTTTSVTFDDCVKQCWVGEAGDLCGCQLPMSGQQAGTADIECPPYVWAMCMLGNDAGNGVRAADFTRSLSVASCNAQCARPCEETQLHYRSWNKKMLRNELGIFLSSFGVSRSAGNVSDFAALNVYFQSLHQTEVAEQASYTWLAYLSDIGGALGLAMGGCLFTLVQLVDLVIFETCEIHFGKERPPLPIAYSTKAIGSR